MIDFHDLALPGSFKLGAGDVVNVFGGEYVVLTANGSSSIVQALSRGPARVEVINGEEIIFSGKLIRARIATQLEKTNFVRRMSDEEFAKYLKPVAAKLEVLNQNEAAEDENNMNKNAKKNSNGNKNNKAPAKGGLAAEALAAKKQETEAAKAAKAAAKPVKSAASTADASAPKVNRKSRIRDLYQSASPMKKSAIVDTIIAEGFNTDAERGKVKAAVDNEASYMKNDGLSPKWLPEDRAATAAAK